MTNNIPINTYQATLRIPAKEAYAYIEINITGSKEQIVQAYFDFTNYYKNQVTEQANKELPF